jgi:DNA-binding XRE family transcriptional regulator
MPVYMIRCGENGPVKIGHSADPAFRLCQLQISHWETLRIIRLFHGDEAEEAGLHARFADLHIRGEWHHFSRAMLGDVGLIEIVDAPPAPTPEPVVIQMEAFDRARLGQQLRRLRASREITQVDLACAMGVSRSAIASIETGHDLPGRDLLWRLSQYFSVPFAMTETAA